MRYQHNKVIHKMIKSKKETKGIKDIKRIVEEA